MMSYTLANGVCRIVKCNVSMAQPTMQRRSTDLETIAWHLASAVGVTCCSIEVRISCRITARAVYLHDCSYTQIVMKSMHMLHAEHVEVAKASPVVAKCASTKQHCCCSAWKPSVFGLFVVWRDLFLA